MMKTKREETFRLSPVFLSQFLVKDNVENFLLSFIEIKRRLR